MVIAVKRQLHLVSVLVTHKETGLTAEEHFGAQVRDAREARGWTQDSLARHLASASGITLSQTAMTRLEGGKRPIRLNEATALSKLLGLNLQAYAGTTQGLTAEEYEQAKAWLQDVVREEAETAGKLAGLQEQVDGEIAELSSRRRLLAIKRLQYEAMIGEYEARSPQADG